MTDKAHLWVPLWKQIENNADRHQANGERYVRDGQLEYADGSFRKAQKNRETAKSFRNFFGLDRHACE